MYKGLNVLFSMVSKKNFILLSMEDDKIKKISNVISNDSCRKILDYLAAKESTESELAVTLGIPISTVHYNLQQLTEAGLVSAEEYHYSEKGKEVNHYKLANKYIIIAPKNTYGIKEKLKSILPVALIAGGAALVIQLVSKFILNGTISTEQAMMAARDVGMAKIAAAPMQESAIQTAQQTAEAVQAVSPYSNIALWFLIGAVFALLIYLIFSSMRKHID